MQIFDYVREGTIIASSQSKILKEVYKDYGKSPGRKNFFDPKITTDAERQILGVYRREQIGFGSDTDFTKRVVGQPYYDAENDRTVEEITEIDLPLEKVQEKLKQKVTKKFQSVTFGGTEITIGENSITLATTHEALVELEGATRRTAEGKTIKVVTRKGARLELDNATATAARDAVEEHFELAQAVEYELKKEIDESSTMEELKNVDIEGADWPSNPKTGL